MRTDGAEIDDGLSPSDVRFPTPTWGQAWLCPGVTAWIPVLAAAVSAPSSGS